jgi:signal peptidase I
VSEPPAHSSSIDLKWLIVAASALFVVGALVLRLVLFNLYSIPSASDEPTLFKGDLILTSRFLTDGGSNPSGPAARQGRLFTRALRRGDVVVFKLPRAPSTALIQRVIGLPGDRVQLKGGVVLINGKPMTRQLIGQVQTDLGGGQLAPVNLFRETTPEGRSYVVQNFPEGGPAEDTGVYGVPPGCYFMLGDNRDNSLDSRYDPGDNPGRCGWDASAGGEGAAEPGVGFVPRENLLGRALSVLISGRKNAAADSRTSKPIR